MTEFSYWWTVDASTPAGDQLAEYSQAHLATVSGILAACSKRDGVAPDYASEFAGSSPAANTFRVAPGAAVVDGRPYENTANEDIAITSASGGGNTRIDRIVLRADWANFTVRLHKIEGSPIGGETNPSPPAITQTRGTTYDVPLFQVRVDTGGTVTIEEDERGWAAVPTSGVEDDAITTAKIVNLAVTSAKLGANAVIAGKIASGGVSATAQLANEIVTAAKIANRTRRFVVPADNLYNETDLTHHPRISSLGYLFNSQDLQHTYGSFIVPDDFASGLTVRAILNNNGVTASQVIRHATLANYGALGEAYNTHTAGGTYADLVVLLDEYQYGAELSLSSATAGDIVVLRYSRDATHANDTFTSGGLYTPGFLVQYTADS